MFLKRFNKNERVGTYLPLTKTVLKQRIFFYRICFSVWHFLNGLHWLLGKTSLVDACLTVSKNLRSYSLCFFTYFFNKYQYDLFNKTHLLSMTANDQILLKIIGSNNCEFCSFSEYLYIIYSKFNPLLNLENLARYLYSM